MRELRLKLICGCALLLGLIGVYSSSRIMEFAGLSMVPALLLLISVAAAALGLSIGISPSKASFGSRAGLGASLAAMFALLAFPVVLRVPVLVSYLSSLPHAFTSLSVLAAVITGAVLILRLYEFLANEDHQRLPQLGKARYAFLLFLILGACRALYIANSESLFFSYSIDLSGISIWGFPGWEYWNGALLVVCILSLIGPTQKVGHYLSLGTWTVLPILANQEFFNQLGAFTGTSQGWVLLILVPVIVTGLLQVLFIESYGEANV